MCNSLYQAEGHKIRVEREGEAATEEASELCDLFKSRIRSPYACLYIGI